MNIPKSLSGNPKNKQLDKMANNERPVRVSPDMEVKLIKRYLEKKLGRRFKAKVKVDGYLDDPVYRLVLNDYDDCRTDGLTYDSHALWGEAVKDVLDVSRGFVDEYWRNVERAIRAEKSGEVLDKFDAGRMAAFRKTAVASSREEMLLRAAAEDEL